MEDPSNRQLSTDESQIVDTDPCIEESPPLNKVRKARLKGPPSVEEAVWMGITAVL